MLATTEMMNSNSSSGGIVNVSGGGGGGISSTDKLEFDSIPHHHLLHHHHQHGVSMDVDLYGGGGGSSSSASRTKAVPMRDSMYGSGNYYGHHSSHAYEGGTFPRKKENQRFRIPSNPSVASKGSGVKNSTGSIEQQPLQQSQPQPQQQRITIDKSVELGITITCNVGGGIFVTSVAENSIASQVRLFHF